MQREIGCASFLRRLKAVETKATKRSHGFIVFLALLLIASCFGASTSIKAGVIQTTGNIEELVRQSRFIFRGTVTQLGASTIPNMAEGKDLAIVHVDEIYLGPKTLSGFAGKNITVRLRETPPTAVGQQWVFFTVGWLFGQSIAVQEVGRIEFRDDTAGVIRQQIAAAIQTIADQDLQRRLARAELVVVGRVTLTRSAAAQPQVPDGSEHDPDLREFVIQVESVEKGSSPSSTAVALYASSIDVAWFQAPKFKEGQDGIFILLRNEIEGLRVQGLTALDAQDFLSRSELERVRRLLRELGPK